jgi:hypothetical protein
MSKAVGLLLLALACGAQGATLPADCGAGSAAVTSCYNGAVFKNTTTDAFVSGAAAPTSYAANSVCIVWEFHCTTEFAAVVAAASQMNALVGAALPCTTQQVGMTATVSTGMDANVCAAGLPTVTALATYLDSWTACSNAANCNVMAAGPTSAALPAARPAAALAALALLAAAW